MILVSTTLLQGSIECVMDSIAQTIVQHHGRGPPEEDDRTDYHAIEARAYRRLKETGLCARGIVPDFYGTMNKFDPKRCTKRLRGFIRAKERSFPNALFIEYIPNMEMLELHNYTEERLDKFVANLREIHDVAFIHTGMLNRGICRLRIRTTQSVRGLSGSISTGRRRMTGIR